MIEKTIQVFTEKEEEFVNRLVRIGTQKTIAKALVYFAKMKEATSRNIELGADLRQPEVSVAMKYLTGKGWIKRHEVRLVNKGRPAKIWNLKVPVERTLDSISKEKEREIKAGMEAIRQVRMFT